VLGVGFGRGGDCEHVIFCAAIRRRHGRHRVFAFGQGAGLVEQHRADGPHALQRQPILDQQTTACGAFGRDGYHQRDRQAQGMRAGDHQHRDGADHRFFGHPDHAPHDRGDDAGSQREPEQPTRRPVGQPLRP